MLSLMLVFILFSCLSNTVCRSGELNVYNINHSYDEESLSRIIDGSHASNIEHYPYMALLGAGGCTASILSECHILTAAHCVVKCSQGECTYRKPVEKIRVYTGGVKLTDMEISKVHKIYPHPLYGLTGNRCSLQHDIAILELEKPLTLNSRTETVTLPDRSSTYFKKCLILGWGLSTTNKTLQDKVPSLKVAETSIISREKCDKMLWPQGRNSIKCDEFICTHDPLGLRGTCFGDSGGPLVCDGVQVGVASWGVRKCRTRDKPNVFVAVEYYLPWIEDVMYAEV